MALRRAFPACPLAAAAAALLLAPTLVQAQAAAPVAVSVSTPAAAPVLESAPIAAAALALAPYFLAPGFMAPHRAQGRRPRPLAPQSPLLLPPLYQLLLPLPLQHRRARLAAQGWRLRRRLKPLLRPIMAPALAFMAPHPAPGWRPHPLAPGLLPSQHQHRLVRLAPRIWPLRRPQRLKLPLRPVPAPGLTPYFMAQPPVPGWRPHPLAPAFPPLPLSLLACQLQHRLAQLAPRVWRLLPHRLKPVQAVQAVQPVQAVPSARPSAPVPRRRWRAWPRHCRALTRRHWPRA